MNMINDNIFVEYCIRIRSSRKCSPAPTVVLSNKFADPNEFTDVALVIGGERLHVSKQVKDCLLVKKYSDYSFENEYWSKHIRHHTFIVS